MRRILLSGLIILLLPVIGYAQTKPTAAEAKKVLDYFYQGEAHGPILVEIKVCQEISKEEGNRNNCGNELAGPVEKGKPVFVWMMFMVPNKSEKQGIIVQYLHKGIARNVREMSISRGFRYRTWNKRVFTKTGKWTVKIVREKDDSTEELGSTTIDVVEEKKTP